jgi:hypothetical protein
MFQNDLQLFENPIFKRGAGYQPAAARAALVFNTEEPAGGRLPADTPPHTAVFTQKRNPDRNGGDR